MSRSASMRNKVRPARGFQQLTYEKVRPTRPLQRLFREKGNSPIPHAIPPQHTPTER